MSRKPLEGTTPDMDAAPEVLRADISSRFIFMTGMAVLSIA